LQFIFSFFIGHLFDINLVILYDLFIIRENTTHKLRVYERRLPFLIDSSCNFCFSRYKKIL